MWIIFIIYVIKTQFEVKLTNICLNIIQVRFQNMQKFIGINRCLESHNVNQKDLNGLSKNLTYIIHETLNVVKIFWYLKFNNYNCCFSIHKSINKIFNVNDLLIL